MLGVSGYLNIGPPSGTWALFKNMVPFGHMGPLRAHGSLSGTWAPFKYMPPLEGIGPLRAWAPQQKCGPSCGLNGPFGPVNYS